MKAVLNSLVNGLSAPRRGLRGCGNSFWSKIDISLGLSNFKAEKGVKMTILAPEQLFSSRNFFSKCRKFRIKAANGLYPSNKNYCEFLWMDNDCVASDLSVVWPQGKRKIGPIHQNMMLDHLLRRPGPLFLSLNIMSQWPETKIRLIWGNCDFSRILDQPPKFCF